jgi:excisionase family DNA binding protein
MTTRSSLRKFATSHSLAIMPKVPNGHLIRQAREDANERIEDVAPDFEISPGTLRGIENGRTYAAETLIQKIADRYNLSVHELMDGVVVELPKRSIPFNERLAYSAEEVALVLGMPYKAVLRAIRDGDLKAAKLGGRKWKVSRDAIDKFLADAIRKSA